MASFGHNKIKDSNTADAVFCSKLLVDLRISSFLCVCVWGGVSKGAAGHRKAVVSRSLHVLGQGQYDNRFQAVKQKRYP